VVLFCLILGVLYPIFGRDKNVFLLHFGGEKLKFDQNRVKWFISWTTELYVLPTKDGSTLRYVTQVEYGTLQKICISTLVGAVRLTLQGNGTE